MIGCRKQNCFYIYSITITDQGPGYCYQGNCKKIRAYRNYLKKYTVECLQKQCIFGVFAKWMLYATVQYSVGIGY